jgi:hypothetical protein
LCIYIPILVQSLKNNKIILIYTKKTLFLFNIYKKKQLNTMLKKFNEFIVEKHDLYIGDYNIGYNVMIMKII